MFEISFPELVILAVVALLVLGPERLPRAAWFAGLWVRRARAHWFDIKSQFERELADGELRKSVEASRGAMADAQASLRETEASLRDTEAELRKRMSEADAAARDIGQDLSGAPSHVDPDAGLAHAPNADSQPPADDSRA